MSPSKEIVGRGSLPMTRNQFAEHRRQSEEKWAAYQANKKQALARRKQPCKHRGKRVSAADAIGPKGVECCKLYECTLHKLCAIVRVLPGIATCANCEQYDAPSKRDPPVDDGRSG